ncbi:hypothetical protein Poli38472_004423 [Pythium oligandrum]|uniref:W2 domain-containing protein n=1 Tax=Pythium oligandrum TaxID=41045 RepID=A0A8K1FFV2_PYTOL|nr:hypothetical protein Poli38472_004423 [Pythium oligandrum]|eukprot:TMW59354.1 hypothetical protein Poli38472_004423 [Pythium oligandrum]
MARRGKKMNLGEFLGDQTAAYIPEAALPTGPRARDEFEDSRGGRGGYGDRRGGFDREASRSEQSDQWRGDRGGFGSRDGGDRFGGRDGDRFGSRDGGDRFGSRGGSRFEESGDNWRSGSSRDMGSRYDRPARGDFRDREPEERPAHMRLNLQRRGESSSASDEPSRGGASDDKWSSAFGSRGGSSGRFGDRGDRFGDRDGGRFGDRGDRFGGRDGDRFSRDRFDDRRGGRFDDRREESVSSSFNNLRVNDDKPSQAAPADEELDKKARAQKLREERKKKAEEERLAAEEAKRKAAEEKKAAEEAAAQKAEGDRAIIAEVLASGKTGEDLAKVAKTVFAKSGRPSGAVIFEAVTKQAESVAKASANWIAPQQYGELLKFAMADAEKDDQVKALYALQVFLNTHDFPKGVMEKCFMALYTLDIIDEAAFFEYKYDVDSDVPGRMKAIVQTSNWLTWLETPEEESEEEDE